MLEAGRKLFTNPEISREAKRLLKKADPSARFADVEMEDELGKVRSENDAKTAALEEKLAKQQAEARLAETRRQLRENGTDVEALETWMKENEVWSYDKAAKIFAQINTPAAATPASMTPMHLPDNKGLWQDPKKWSNDEAYATMNDIMANRGKQQRTA